MDFLPEAISQYAEAHSSPESPLLRQLNRETHLKVLMPRMLSGHLQGRILAMLSHMLRPAYILEIGTYTGYSALCLAEGMQADGKLITIDINEEREGLVKRYIQEAGWQDRIVPMIGKALELIPSLPAGIDLVFIDADKINNQAYYDLVFDKVRSGGFILIDNVLWSGKVATSAKDKDTLAMQAFNDYVQADERVENVLLPLRDGLMLVRKKP